MLNVPLAFSWFNFLGELTMTETRQLIQKCTGRGATKQRRKKGAAKKAAATRTVEY